MHTPPTTSRISITATRLPRFTAETAARWPEGPEPITNKSYSLIAEPEILTHNPRRRFDPDAIRAFFATPAIIGYFYSREQLSTSLFEREHPKQQVNALILQRHLAVRLVNICNPKAKGRFRNEAQSPAIYLCAT
jgi:hypothetical protein